MEKDISDNVKDDTVQSVSQRIIDEFLVALADNEELEPIAKKLRNELLSGKKFSEQAIRKVILGEESQ